MITDITVYVTNHTRLYLRDSRKEIPERFQKDCRKGHTRRFFLVLKAQMKLTNRIRVLIQHETVSILESGSVLYDMPRARWALDGKSEPECKISR